MIEQTPNIESLMALHAAIRPVHKTLSKNELLSWEQVDPIIEALDNLDAEALAPVEQLVGGVERLTELLRKNINNGVLRDPNGETVQEILDEVMGLEAIASVMEAKSHD